MAQQHSVAARQTALSQFENNIVVIHEDDAVQAMAFKTEEEAQRFVYDAATKLAAFANEEKPDVDIPDA